jgi:multidrug resistance efflux pump
MLIKLGVPILAAAALGFGAATTIILEPEEQLTPAHNPPATTTFGANTVAGLGEVQSPGEAVVVGAPLSGLVTRVHVVTGDAVSRADPLYQLDDRELRAQLRLRERALVTAEARLDRLRAGTRPEDLPPAWARVEASKVAVDRARDLLDRGRLLMNEGAMGHEEMKLREFTLREAEAGLLVAEADLARLEAGTWQPEILIAERERDEAEAAVDWVNTELDRLVVRSPADGVVLRVDVREGEFVGGDNALAATGPRQPVVLARAGPLQVRVQVDEEDASRVVPGAVAEGFVRGRERVRVELRFLRIEPRVVPKTSLTGGTTERVDTRVLYVVYEMAAKPTRIYPGQKLDVFINVQQ